MKNYFFPILFALLSFGCSSSIKYYSFDETQELINQKFNDSLFAHAHWGVLIESLSNGKVWYEKNPDKMFMPASNEKIPTSASALITLGPDFKYETRLFYTGEIVDSILKGNLVVKGNGDPTFFIKSKETSLVTMILSMI